MKTDQRWFCWRLSHKNELCIQTQKNRKRLSVKMRIYTVNSMVFVECASQGCPDLLSGEHRTTLLNQNNSWISPLRADEPRVAQGSPILIQNIIRCCDFLINYNLIGIYIKIYEWCLIYSIFVFSVINIGVQPLSHGHGIKLGVDAVIKTRKHPKKTTHHHHHHYDEEEEVPTFIQENISFNLSLRTNFFRIIVILSLCIV